LFFYFVDNLLEEHKAISYINFFILLCFYFLEYFLEEHKVITYINYVILLLCCLADFLLVNALALLKGTLLN